MPSVPLDDKRQQWLREHTLRPESIQRFDINKFRVVMDTENEHFGQFYKICAMQTPYGTRYRHQYYGEQLADIEKAQLAEGFNAFLKAHGPQKQPTNDTLKVANIKREESKAPKKPDDSIDVPVVLYSKNNERPSQFTARASLAKNGVLFNWREELLPHVTREKTVFFERWMGDGTFASPREQLEWVPQGRVLVYKVAGVVNCPNIAQFASGCSQNPPTRSLPSPPPSSPAGNSNNAISQPSSSGSILRKRSLELRDNLRGKRARHLSPVQGMIHREEHIVNLISDDEDIPRVLPKHKGKGKARAPNLDDVIDLSD